MIGVRRDVGSSTLTTVLLTPVFVAIAFMAFQAALWTHTRTEARAAARHAAVQVARQGADPDRVVAVTTEALAAATPLDNPLVTVDGVDARSQAVTVTVSGRAPGMLRGMSTDVSVSELVPKEGWRP